MSTMSWGPDGGGMVPEGFDPARETPEMADRDSQGPARLAALMRDMDVLCDEFRRHRNTRDVELSASIGSDLVVKWWAIRKEMGA